jgi:hypothetical protein
MATRSLELDGPRATARQGEGPGVLILVGASALVFSLLYLASDVIELLQGDFSTTQLALTYAGEAAIPLFVLGLYALQRPRIGRLGLAGAVAYAYTFVFFTSTVVYALVNGTNDWSALERQFGAWITVHAVLMVLAGVMFGLAVLRARVLPQWTGATLIAGMVLMAATASLPDVVRTASAGVRDLAFAAMGLSLLRAASRRGATIRRRKQGNVVRIRTVSEAATTPASPGADHPPGQRPHLASRSLTRLPPSR